MALEDDLKTTIIKSLTLEDKPEKPETPYEIRTATDDDFNLINSLPEHSERDLQILQEADLCTIVRDGLDIVHHTCMALKSFQHSRVPLPIELQKTDAYVYNVWTKKSHRGQGIFQTVQSWLADQLYKSNIQNVYTEIDELNEPSQRAFQKAGFQKTGERHTIDAGEYTVHVISGESIYQNTTTLTTQMGDIEIAKTRDYRFERIEQELKPYIEQWNNGGNDVALFGSGNHAKKILDRTELGSVVGYAVDEDSEKIGSKISDSDIPVVPLDKLSEEPPDTVVICSEAFQNYMATRAKAKLQAKEIVVLYPHVSLFEKKN